MHRKLKSSYILKVSWGHLQQEAPNVEGLPHWCPHIEYSHRFVFLRVLKCKKLARSFCNCSSASTDSQLKTYWPTAVRCGTPAALQLKEKTCSRGQDSWVEHPTTLAIFSHGRILRRSQTASHGLQLPVLAWMCVCVFMVQRGFTVSQAVTIKLLFYLMAVNKKADYTSYSTRSICNAPSPSQTMTPCVSTCWADGAMRWSMLESVLTVHVRVTCWDMDVSVCR